MSDKPRVDEWVAFFGDYRDLTTGLLYQKGKEPQAFLNIASVFEVVNKMHLDIALRDIERLEARIQKLREALIMAKLELSCEHCESEHHNNADQIVREALQADDEQMNPSKPHLEGNI